MSDTVLIPFNGRWLALGPEALQEALRRGREAMGDPEPENAQHSTPERILDAEGMEAATQIPASWFLEQARKGTLPHIRAGKYVRFDLAKTLEFLTSTDGLYTDRRAVTLRKHMQEQQDRRSCYQPATRKTGTA